MTDLSKCKKCIECKYYDPSPFPEYNGKLALCRGSSYQYKIGCFTLADRECFEPKDDFLHHTDH